MINVAGAFSKYKILIQFLLKNKKYLKNFCVYDSASFSKWNGGRINSLVKSDFSIEKLKTYNKLGVGVFITFSNYRIDDLKSSFENHVLNALNESTLNGVIITNLKLNNYIKQNYKNLKRILSCTFFENTNLSNFDFNFLESSFDLICPRYEWVFDKNFYNNINKNKYEILLNDCCARHCKFWNKHFKAISDANRLGINDINICNKIQNCWIMNDIDNPWNGWHEDLKQFPVLSGMNMSLNDIFELKKIGYSSFKICGRESSDKMFLDEITEYTGFLWKY